MVTEKVNCWKITNSQLRNRLGNRHLEKFFDLGNYTNVPGVLPREQHSPPT